MSSNSFTNGKFTILDVVADGPTIKLLANSLTINEEQKIYINEVIQKYYKCQLTKLPPPEISVGVITIASLDINDESSTFCRVQIVDNKEWNNGYVSVLLVDDCKWNCRVGCSRLHCCPPDLREIPFCSEAFYLADITPPMLSNSWSDHCINSLKAQLIGKDLNGTVFREKNKMALFRPYEPTDQGQLLARAMAQCGMADICPSFPGLYPLPPPELNYIQSNHLVKKSFLYLPEPHKSKFPTMNVHPLLQCPSLSKSNGNLSARNGHTEQSSTTRQVGDTVSVMAHSQDTTAETRYFAVRPEAGDTDKCIVTHIENGPWKFCLRKRSQDELLRCLDQTMSEIVTKGKLVSQLKVDRGGTPVLCKSEKCNKYCRGLILGKTNEKIDVLLVDIGNEEELPPDKVWVLPQELLKLPILVIRCRLQGLPPSRNYRVSQNFVELVQNRTLNVTFGRVTSDLLVTVSLELGNYSVVKLITNQAFDQQSFINDAEVVLSNVSDDIIYLHLANAQDRIDELQLKVQEHSSKLGPLREPVLGQPCLAMFSEDKNWYRAMILSLQNGIKVRFVDYGNEEEYLTPEKLKEIDSTLLTYLPSQAIPCVIDGLEDKNLSSNDIFNWLGDDKLMVITSELLTKEIDGIPTSIQKVKLVQSANSLSEDLLSQKKRNDYFSDEVAQTRDNLNGGAVQQVPIVPDWLKLCAVTHVVSPLHFYVTLIQNEKDIKIIHETLISLYDAHSAYDSLAQPSEGEHVMIRSKSPSGEFFHRAIVNSSSLHLLELKLVDIGREQIVTKHEVKPLPPQASLTRFPAQAIKCGLENTSCHAAEKDAFKSTVMRDTVNVHFIRKEGDTWKVALLKTCDLGYDSNTVPEDEISPHDIPDCSPLKSRNLLKLDGRRECLQNSSPERESMTRAQGAVSKTSRRNYDSGCLESKTKSWPIPNERKPVDDIGSNGGARCRLPLVPALVEPNPEGKGSERRQTPKDVLELGKKLPPQPLLGVAGTVFVTYHDDTSNVTWVQRKEDLPLLFKLNANIDNEVMSSKSLRDASHGRLCLCQSTEDDMWYRGVVMSTETTYITVHYIDYGNSERISRSKAKELSHLLRDPHKLAYSCVLNGKTSESGESFLANFVDEEIEISVVSKEKGYYIVELVANSTKPLQEKRTSQIDTELKSQKCTDLMVIPQLEPPIGVELELLVCHIDDDGALWVQLLSNASNVDQLHNDLSALSDNAENLETCQVGTCCVGKYSEDGEWYRAKVITVNTQKREAIVRFVDFGNVEIICLEELKVLPESCSTLPAQAICSNIYSNQLYCALKGKEIKQKLEWLGSETIITGSFQRDATCDLILVNGSFNGEPLDSKILATYSTENADHSADDEASEISLSDVNERTSDSSSSFATSAFPLKDSRAITIYDGDSCDMANDVVVEESIENLQDAGVVEVVEDSQNTLSLIKNSIPLPELLYDETLTLMITFVEEDGFIWVQNLSHAEQLETLMKNIEAYIKPKSLEPSHDRLDIGSFVISKFPEDNEWYRGKILTMENNNTVLVHYVDFGNVCNVLVNDVYTIAEEFCTLPSQAFSCVLESYTEHTDSDNREVIGILFSLGSFEGKISKKGNLNILRDITIDGISFTDFRKRFCSSEITIETVDELQPFLTDEHLMNINEKLVNKDECETNQVENELLKRDIGSEVLVITKGESISENKSILEKVNSEFTDNVEPVTHVNTGDPRECTADEYIKIITDHTIKSEFSPENEELPADVVTVEPKIELVDSNLSESAIKYLSSESLEPDFANESEEYFIDMDTAEPKNELIDSNVSQSDVEESVPANVYFELANETEESPIDVNTADTSSKVIDLAENKIMKPEFTSEKEKSFTVVNAADPKSELKVKLSAAVENTTLESTDPEFIREREKQFTSGDTSELRIDLIDFVEMINRSEKSANVDNQSKSQFIDSTVNGTVFGNVAPENIDQEFTNKSVELSSDVNATEPVCEPMCCAIGEAFVKNAASERIEQKITDETILLPSDENILKPKSEADLEKTSPASIEVSHVTRNEDPLTDVNTAESKDEMDDTTGHETEENIFYESMEFKLSDGGNEFPGDADNVEPKNEAVDENTAAENVSLKFTNDPPADVNHAELQHENIDWIVKFVNELENLVPENMEPEFGEESEKQPADMSIIKPESELIHSTVRKFVETAECQEPEFTNESAKQLADVNFATPKSELTDSTVSEVENLVPEIMELELIDCEQVDWAVRKDIENRPEHIEPKYNDGSGEKSVFTNNAEPKRDSTENQSLEMTSEGCVNSAELKNKGIDSTKNEIVLENFSFENVESEFTNENGKSYKDVSPTEPESEREDPYVSATESIHPEFNDESQGSPTNDDNAESKNELVDSAIMEVIENSTQYLEPEFSYESIEQSIFMNSAESKSEMMDSTENESCLEIINESVMNELINWTESEAAVKNQAPESVEPDLTNKNEELSTQVNTAEPKSKLEDSPKCEFVENYANDIEPKLTKQKEEYFTAELNNEFEKNANFIESVIENKTRGESINLEFTNKSEESPADLNTLEPKSNLIENVVSENIELELIKESVEPPILVTSGESENEYAVESIDHQLTDQNEKSSRIMKNTQSKDLSTSFLNEIGLENIAQKSIDSGLINEREEPLSDVNVREYRKEPTELIENNEPAIIVNTAEYQSEHVVSTAAHENIELNESKESSTVVNTTDLKIEVILENTASEISGPGITNERGESTTLEPKCDLSDSNVNEAFAEYVVPESVEHKFDNEKQELSTDMNTVEPIGEVGVIYVRRYVVENTAPESIKPELTRESEVLPTVVYTTDAESVLEDFNVREFVEHSTDQIEYEFNTGSVEPSFDVNTEASELVLEQNSNVSESLIEIIGSGNTKPEVTTESDESFADVNTIQPKSELLDSTANEARVDPSPDDTKPELTEEGEKSPTKVNTEKAKGLPVLDITIPETIFPELTIESGGLPAVMNTVELTGGFGHLIEKAVVEDRTECMKPEFTNETKGLPAAVNTEEVQSENIVSTISVDDKISSLDNIDSESIYKTEEIFTDLLSLSLGSIGSSPSANEQSNEDDVCDLDSLWELVIYGTVVHISENPLLLWINRDEDTQELTEIEMSLSDEINKGLKKVLKIDVGKVFCSYFCGNLMRIKILALNPTTVSVHFIDVGNKSFTSYENIFECPAKVVGIPPMAQPYLLPVHINEKDSSEIFSLVKTQCLRMSCTCIELDSYLRSSTKRDYPYGEIAVDTVGSISGLLINRGLGTDFTHKEIVHIELLKEFRQAVEESFKLL